MPVILLLVEIEEALNAAHCVECSNETQLCARTLVGRIAAASVPSARYRRFRSVLLGASRRCRRGPVAFLWLVSECIEWCCPERLLFVPKLWTP